MAKYKAKPRPDVEAFQFGSLEEKPDWLKAAYLCGLVRETDHTNADGPFLSVGDRGQWAARGDYLVWDSELRNIRIWSRGSFEATYEVPK